MAGAEIPGISDTVQRNHGLQNALENFFRPWGGGPHPGIDPQGAGKVLGSVDGQKTDTWPKQNLWFFFEIN